MSVTPNRPLRAEHCWWALARDALVRTLLVASALFLVSHFDLRWGWLGLCLIPITILQHALTPLAKRGVFGEASSFALVVAGTAVALVFTALQGAYLSTLVASSDPELAIAAAMEAASALLATERAESFPPGLWVLVVSLGTAAAVLRQIGTWSWQLVWLAPLAPLPFGRGDGFGPAAGALVFAVGAGGALLLVCRASEVICGMGAVAEARGADAGG